MYIYNEWKYMISLIELESKNINEYRVEEHTSEMINLIEEELSYLRNNFFCLSAGQSLIIIFYNKTFWNARNSIINKTSFFLWVFI